MDTLNFEVLSLLKNQFEKAVGNKKYQITDIGENFSARQFYLENLEDNLFEAMTPITLSQYSSGSGNELKDKMKALRSSSAMTYNILGNKPIIINGVNYQTQFEWQYRTLKTSSIPANLDALLVSESGDVIACEMKMLEWLPNSFSVVRKAYLNENSYFDKKTAGAFIPVFESLIGFLEVCKARNFDKFGCCFNHYDAFQMIKHCIALYNACKKGDLQCKKLTLLNCVWELSLVEDLSPNAKKKYLSALEQEHEGYKTFYSAINPIVELFDEMGIEFDIVYQNSSDFIASIELDAKHRDYLKRYTFE